MRCFPRLRFYSLFRVEAEHIMAFTFVCFSELSFGACSSAVTSLVACFCSSLLSSIIYLGHCSHSSIQRYFRCPHLEETQLSHCCCLSQDVQEISGCSACDNSTNLSFIFFCAFFSFSRYPSSLERSMLAIISLLLQYHPS